MIYLDNSATTQPCEACVRAMTELLTDCWGNPSSVHAHGIAAHHRLRQAREQVASALGAEPDRVFFTSGGTEADNWAIFSAAERLGKRGHHIVTTAVEHHAFELGVKVGKEIRAAEQHPVEEQDIVNLHGVKHEQKPREEGPKAELVPDAVPHGKRGCAEKEQHGKPLDHPAEGVRAAEALLPVGDGGQILLRGGGEKALILNEADRAVEQEKIG